MFTLDHVAIGVADARPVLDVLTAELGGTVINGGSPPGAGFRFVHVHLGEPTTPGMTIELIEPHEPHTDHFLERFLAGRGDGPHHLTFTTESVESERRRLLDLGVKPIGVRFDDPHWKEMFIHPKDAGGVVVQIAQSGSPPAPIEARLRRARGEDGTFGGRNWWGDHAGRRATRSVRLRRVVLASTRVATAERFWCEVLGATKAGSGLTWTGGGIALVDGDVDGVGHLEVEGLAREIVVGGTRLVPAAG